MVFVQADLEQFAAHDLDGDVRLVGHQAAEAHRDAALAQRLDLLALGHVVQGQSDLGARAVELRQQCRNHAQAAGPKDAAIRPASSA
jgi:hypothetical protein